MILPFSTQLNGKPTLFIEKIWEGFFRNDFFDGKDTEFIKYFDLHREKFGKAWDELPADTRLETPKIHTIRKDEKDRWKPGILIDFFINNRSKNAFRFAPRIPVISTQSIKIRYSIFNYDGKQILKPAVWIDNKLIYDYAQQGEIEMKRLARNDGFDTIVEFFNYFNENFEGKIIHWTNFKYE